MINYVEVKKDKMFKKHVLLLAGIASLITVCLVLIGLDHSVFKFNNAKTVMMDSQEQKNKEKSAAVSNNQVNKTASTSFNSNYKLEIRNIKKADYNKTFEPGMDELWIVYPYGIEKKLISPVLFGSQSSYKPNAVTNIGDLTVSSDRTRIYFYSSLGVDCATIYKFDLLTNTLDPLCFGEFHGLVTEGKYKDDLKVYERFSGTDQYVWKYVLLDDNGKQVGTWEPDNNNTN